MDDRNREEVHIGRGPRVRIETGWLVAVVAIIAVVGLAALVMVMAFDSGNRPEPNPAAAPVSAAATPTPTVIEKVVVATPTPGPTPTPVVIIKEVPVVREVIKEVVVTSTPAPTPTPTIVERVIEKVVVATPTPTPAPAGPRVVYTNDFEGVVGTEWSKGKTALMPLKNHRFLGQFRKEGVTLTLTGLPTHKEVTVSFTLYLAGRWVGNDYGETSVWASSVVNGPTLLNTTFSNISHYQQNYPDAYPGDRHRGRSGATEINTSGFGGSLGDTAYKLSFTFLHSLETLAVSFSGLASQLGWISEIKEASWGLDNIVVKVQ